MPPNYCFTLLNLIFERPRTRESIGWRLHQWSTIAQSSSCEDYRYGCTRHSALCHQPTGRTDCHDLASLTCIRLLPSCVFHTDVSQKSWRATLKLARSNPVRSADRNHALSPLISNRRSTSTRTLIRMARCSSGKSEKGSFATVYVSQPRCPV
jgi:hypothetical protein